MVKPRVDAGIEHGLEPQEHAEIPRQTLWIYIQQKFKLLEAGRS